MSARCRTLVNIGLFSALLSSGCATLDIPWFDRLPEASRKNPVVQVVCMWEPSEGRDPQGAPCRGFAGQILFLGNRGGTPVKVEGDVSVYVFDDLGTEEEQAAPIHQFNFDAGAWNRHLQNGSLGPAYYCFIPYTRAGNYAANCTVHLKYTPKEGQALTSDASHIALRGKSRTGEPEQQYAGRFPQAFETSRPSDARGSRTTTIPLDSRGRYQPEESDSGVVPASYSAEDRAQQILDDFRREREAASRRGTIDRRTSASPRMKLHRTPTHADVNDQMEAEVAAADGQVAESQDFLSSHPFAAGVQTKPSPRHSWLNGDAEVRNRDSDFRVQATSLDRWVPTGEDDVHESTDGVVDEDLDRQTTHVDR